MEPNHKSGEQVKKYLAGFIELNWSRSKISSVRWPELSDAAQFGQEGKASCITGNHVNIYTVGLRQTDTETLQTVFEKLVALAKSHASFNGRFGMQRYSNVATMATPQHETVYPWREIKTQVLLRNWYKDPSLDVDVDPFMREVRSLSALTSGFNKVQPYYGGSYEESWK
ncbi:hypothetical protein HYFRA_00006142 [Hymenoscyphus fraxineus]|uniref:Uncharacterized protein n=1 Tax=Hymenoscyphus fraxineus TaxID=746836 RepID=A0A9N9LAP7_9HELO|nr:hypothetical protein HYFRA_00006142 [Hymenoscyphus fraxineus]